MIEVRVDSASLQSFVVRLRSAQGKTLGSGVLVADGRILTCAHVVAGVAEVLVQGSGIQGSTGATPAAGYPATVLARSRPPSRRDDLWPFPDLALLEFDAAGLMHPVAPLDPALPAGVSPILNDDRLSGWGFPRRQEGVDPPGSAASFVVEGVEGDGFVTVKAGQAQPGLSGAPMVCPRTRTVIGLMSATRSSSQDLGGYVSPTSALMEPSHFLSDVGQDPAEILADLLDQNRRASLSDRSPWLAVLRSPEAKHLVEEPWASFQKTKRSDPADLLRADFGVVEYLFRDNELERQRREWCESPDPLGILVVRGLGGSGKTRFAIQLCRRMQQRGWLSGWLPLVDHEVLTVPIPRLLVMDYVEATGPQRLARVMMQLSATASSLAPARLVLLTRTRVGGLSDPLETLSENANARIKQILAFGEETSDVTQALTGAQREALYEKAVKAFCTAWGSGRPGVRPDLSHERYQLPLEVLFEALDHALSDDENVGLSSLPPVERVLAHEERIWRGMLPEVELPLLQWTAAASTITGAANDTEAHALLASYSGLAGEEQAGLRERLIRWWADMVPGGQLLSPLQPDKLGEHAAGKFLVELDSEGVPVLGRLVSSLSDRQVSSTLDFLARTQAANAAVEDLTDLVLDTHFTSLVERAQQAAGRSATGEVNRSLADAVLRLLSARRLQRLVPDDSALAEDPSGYFDRGLACIKLSDLASTAGGVADARSLCQSAKRILQKLAALEPETPDYFHHMAMADLRLADLDRKAGLLEQARAGYHAYLEEMQELVRRNPRNLGYRRELAVASSRVADLHRAAGRHERARIGYRAYLDGMRELLRLDPRNLDFRRGVAVGHARLADLDRAAGFPDRARVGYRRYLDQMRELVRLEPHNLEYRHAAAVGQVRLAHLDRLARHPERARGRYQRYLDEMLELARLDPDNLNYRKGVAVGYGQLADIDRVAGLLDRARGRYERYLAGMVDLSRLDPENLEYRRSVAVGYGRLADMDLAAGLREQARIGYRRYLSVIRELTRLDPENLNYRRELAIARSQLARVE
ncbi:trypsin-like peptidase domain-containing protein [Micromonospora chersina]|uniref:trypsin-like peptidase domain-containing protein n=1 Tax=Micromonospora chersina TaxID=47854 RepID=UPI0033D4D57A